jgi:uncharacterized protein (DUF1778 family)
MYTQEVAGMAKDHVLNARISGADLELLKRAAELSGMSTSSFVTQTALREAELLTASVDVTVMKAEQFAALMASLDDPDPAPRLAKAFRENPA